MLMLSDQAFGLLFEVLATRTHFALSQVRLVPERGRILLKVPVVESGNVSVNTQRGREGLMFSPGYHGSGCWLVSKRKVNELINNKRKTFVLSPERKYDREG